MSFPVSTLKVIFPEYKEPLNEKAIEITKASDIKDDSPRTNVSKDTHTHKFDTEEIKEKVNTKEEGSTTLPILFAPSVKTDPLDRDNLIARAKTRKFKGLNFTIDSTIVTADEEMALDTALANVERHKSPSESTHGNSSIVKKLILQALEIKKLFNETHDFFLHGQSTSWLGTSYLTKELARLLFPHKDIHCFKFLRTPTNNADSDENSITPHKKLNDDDPNILKGLLSVSPYVFDHSSYESALDFLGRNKSMYGHTTKAYKEMVDQFCDPKMPNSERYNFVQKIQSAQLELESKATCGTLFSFCIPKKVIIEKKEKIAFRCHPHAKPCNCHPSESISSTMILDKLQQNILDTTTKCTRSSIPIPQYRLQINRITPEQGSLVFRHTPFAIEDIKEFKKKIASIVAEIKNYKPKFSFV
jgi:hypothetical protein